MSMDFFGSHTDSEAIWPDFYELLSLAPDATADEVRARISRAYLQALANVDHRQIERRDQYKTMIERVIPQARRILLDEQTRQLYDEQLALHQAGDASALPYAEFVAQLLQAEHDAAEEAASGTQTTLLTLPSPDDFSLPVTTPSATTPSATKSSLPRSSDTRSSDTRSSDTRSSDTSASEVLRAKKETSEPVPSVIDTSAAADYQATAPDTSSDDTLSDEEKRAARIEARRSARHLAVSNVPIDATNKDDEFANAEVANAEAANAEASSSEALAPQSRTRHAQYTSDFLLDDGIPILARAIPEAPQEETENKTPGVSAPLSALEREARSELAAAQARVLHVDPNRKPPAPGNDATDGARSDGDVTPLEEEARRARVLRVERGARPLTTAQLEASSGQDLGNGVRGIVSSRREVTDTPNKTRVSVGSGYNPRRVLPQGALVALTALTSAGLMFLILRLQSPAAISTPNSVNAASAASTLQIEYSNELQPIMESAQQSFGKTKSGRGVSLDLRPTDALDAMQAALRPNAALPAAWIPTEALWSDRFNRLAAQNKQPVIGATRALALSPLVLIARDDHADALKRAFPEHKIASWDALRSAIPVGASHHFGLTNPHLSGAGALSRWFMAREWSANRNLSWNKKTASDARLWQWMSGFEDNVPDNAASTGDMVQDLVLGNSDRYWWAIAYESDAIKWLRAGKPIQVFYLPQTAFAEHPFCTFERADSSTRNRRARTAFEAFLRSRPMQIALAQNGFRPTEIRLADVPHNPFARRDWRARGLRENGFRIDQRLNTDVLDALVKAWKARY